VLNLPKIGAGVIRNLLILLKTTGEQMMKAETIAAQGRPVRLYRPVQDLRLLYSLYRPYRGYGISGYHI
jgi:hypothetical protein